jgi:hypothetical protein
MLLHLRVSQEKNEIKKKIQQTSDFNLIVRGMNPHHICGVGLVVISQQP